MLINSVILTDVDTHTDFHSLYRADVNVQIHF